MPTNLDSSSSLVRQSSGTTMTNSNNNSSENDGQNKNHQHGLSDQSLLPNGALRHHRDESDHWFCLVKQLDKPPQMKLTNIFQQSKNQDLFKLFQLVTSKKEIFEKFWNHGNVDDNNISSSIVSELSMRLRSILYDSFVTNHVLFNNDISLAQYSQFSEFHSLENDFTLLEESKSDTNKDRVHPSDMLKYHYIEQAFISNLFTLQSPIKVQYDDESVEFLSSLKDADAMMMPLSEESGEEDVSTPTQKKQKKKIITTTKQTKKKPKHEHSWVLTGNSSLIALYDAMWNAFSTIHDMEDAWPFRKPVTKAQAKDYFDIIEKPMDLSKISKKLESLSYRSKNDFRDDFKLMFSNCRTYNTEPGNIYVTAADNLEKTFDSLFDSIPDTVVDSEPVDENIPTTYEIEDDGWNFIDSELSSKIENTLVLPAKDLTTYKELKNKLKQESQICNNIDIFDRDQRWNILTRDLRTPSVKLREQNRIPKLQRDALGAFYLENISSETRCNFPEYFYTVALPDYGTKLSSSSLREIAFHMIAKTPSEDRVKNQMTQISNLGFKLGLRDRSMIAQFYNQSAQLTKLQHTVQTMLKCSYESVSGECQTPTTLLFKKGGAEPSTPKSPGGRASRSSKTITATKSPPSPQDEGPFIGFNYSISNDCLLKQNVDKIIQLREKRKSLLASSHKRQNVKSSSSSSKSTESSATATDTTNRSIVTGKNEMLLSQNATSGNVYDALTCITSMILCHEGFEGAKLGALNVLTDVLRSYISCFGLVLSNNDLEGSLSEEQVMMRACEEMFGRNIIVEDLKHLKQSVESSVDMVSSKLKIVETKLNTRTNKPTKTKGATKTKLSEVQPEKQKASTGSGSPNTTTTVPENTSEAAATGAESQIDTKEEDEEDILQLTSPAGILMDENLSDQEVTDAAGMAKKRSRDVFEDDVPLDDLEGI
ncbi:hypothetical protein C9374_007491 [Naegleria lovaniensis]|uniref:Bromo domain-containing protein n=1 Tax=Naegleria lovaniensis TaxID=51637 RepID=A0AA88GL14_NAELO|nr:uncharacterized protein C9374_007491 [Naegleria lovaniensis]KAG2379352.1 hypothetical protein C9374_007491 [Naegleria lovaniensis]